MHGKRMGTYSVNFKKREGYIAGKGAEVTGSELICTEIQFYLKHD